MCRSCGMCVRRNQGPFAKLTYRHLLLSLLTNILHMAVIFHLASGIIVQRELPFLARLVQTIIASALHWYHLS